MDGQGTLWRRNSVENFNRLSRAHERYRRQTDDRRQTDGRTTTYSEPELEFTFAKNRFASVSLSLSVSVCMSVGTLTVAFLDQFSPKLAQTLEAKSKNEFVMGQ